MSSLLAALFNGAIVSALITAAVWLAMLLTPRRVFNAASRYVTWWATLAVVVILPVFYLPRPVAKPIAYIAPVIEEPTVTVESAPPAAIPALAPVDAPSSRGPRFPIEFAAGRWPQAILAAWGVIAMLLLLRLGVSCALLDRRKARAFPAPANLTARVEEWLTLCSTKRRVRLAGSADIVTPMAAGLLRPAILIPARLFDELEEGELDQIGLHETAHLARRDDYALILQRALEALFALHPVVRWITRRIDLEREIACDDFVIEATGRARPYAACLTRVVELAGGVRASLVAAAATEERSHLARRVEMLLDKTRHTGTRLLKARLTAVVAALIALAWVSAKTPGLVAFAMQSEDAFEQAQMPEPPQPAQPPAPPAPVASTRPARPFAMPAPYALPSTPAIAPEAPLPPIAAQVAMAPQAPPQPPAPQAPRSYSSYEMNRHGDSSIDWHWRDGLSARDLRIQGTVEFTDDESDIKSISPGGWFSLEESHGFASRRYQAASDSSGQLTRKYLVDGRETPLDEQGRAWLRATLPEILREGGFDVPGRVRRIMRQGGSAAVLTEIQKIRGNGSKRRYIQELVPIGNLSADQYQTVLRTVRGMGSDGDKASLLIFLGRYTMKDNLRDYAFDAVSTINSSGDRRRVLLSLAQDDPSRATLTAVARSTEGINSDGDKAAVLVELAAHYRGNEDMRRPYFRAASTINSSGDRARVLMAVIGAAGEHRDTLADALRATAGIPSDGDKARVLVHAAAYWKDDDAVRRAYFEAANSVNSAGDHARILNAVLGRSGVTDATLLDSVQSAGRINSDGDKARVLLAILQRPGASTEVLIAAVQAAAHLNSDGEKGRVLLEAAQRASGKPTLRTEIRTAVRTLHSDGEYRRVMSVLDKETAI